MRRGSQEFVEAAGGAVAAPDRPHTTRSGNSTLEQGLGQVADRLIARRDAGADEQRRIRDWVAEAASAFRDARVTTFVPVLVERRVRARLAAAV